MSRALYTKKERDEIIKEKLEKKLGKKLGIRTMKDTGEYWGELENFQYNWLEYYDFIMNSKIYESYYNKYMKIGFKELEDKSGGLITNRYLFGLEGFGLDDDPPMMHSLKECIIGGSMTLYSTSIRDLLFMHGVFSFINDDGGKYSKIDPGLDSYFSNQTFDDVGLIDRATEITIQKAKTLCAHIKSDPLEIYTPDNSFNVFILYLKNVIENESNSWLNNYDIEFIELYRIYSLQMITAHILAGLIHDKRLKDEDIELDNVLIEMPEGFIRNYCFNENKE